MMLSTTIEGFCMPDSSKAARRKRRVKLQNDGVFDLSSLVYIPAHLLLDVKEVKLPKLTQKQSITYNRMFCKIYDGINKDRYGDSKST